MSTWRCIAWTASPATGISISTTTRASGWHRMPAGAVRPAPLINGHDLIAAGFHPGPRFAEILAAVEDAQLEGTIATRDEAMGFAESNFPPPVDSDSPVAHVRLPLANVGEMIGAPLRYNRPMEQVSSTLQRIMAQALKRLPPENCPQPHGTLPPEERWRKKPACWAAIWFAIPAARSKPCWSRFLTPPGARSSTPWLRSFSRGSTSSSAIERIEFKLARPQGAGETLIVAFHLLSTAS